MFSKNGFMVILFAVSATSIMSDPASSQPIRHEKSRRNIPPDAVVGGGDSASGAVFTSSGSVVIQSTVSSAGQFILDVRDNAGISLNRTNQNGNVGIGANPGVKFHLSSGTMYLDGSSPQFSMGTSGIAGNDHAVDFTIGASNELTIKAANSRNLRIEDESGTNRIFLQDGGRVAINTNIPDTAAQLTVNGSEIVNSTSTIQLHPVLRVNNLSGNAIFTVQQGSNVVLSAGATVQTSGNFYISTSATSGNPAVFIGTSGETSFSPFLSSNTLGGTQMTTAFANTSLSTCAVGSTVTLTATGLEAGFLIAYVGAVTVTAGNTAFISYAVDGVVQYSAAGIVRHTSSGGGERGNFSFVDLLPAQSAGQHDFCVATAVDAGIGTFSGSHGRLWAVAIK